MKRFLKILSLVAVLCASFAWGALSYPVFGWKAKIVNVFFKEKKELLYPVAEHKPFVIIIPSYNNIEWVEKNLKSIFAQKYDNYRIIYIDDASRDGTDERVKDLAALAQHEHHFELIQNESNQGACENIYRAVHSCRDDEIAIILDGDDWLAHDRVLERLNEIYANHDVWMTYGSYIEYPTYSYTVANFARQLPRKIIKNNRIRSFTRKHWCLSHLRTFYVGLFKKIKSRDLLLDGKYYDTTYDLGFMIPMVEMAGDHVKFVKDVLYIYNRATPFNDNKIKAIRQQQIANHIFDLPCYAKLTSLSAEGRYEKEIR